MHHSPGYHFRQLLGKSHALPIVGAVNAYHALMAEKIGHQAIYLSGGGVANASFGMPDLGITTLNDVLTDVNRISAACNLPLLVDIDTGWGGTFSIARTIKLMEKSGVAAVHIEDQVNQKRCGHRPNKQLVDRPEMVDRIKAATDARKDSNFVIMARTDAVAQEGIEAALERAQYYIEAGADMLFPEAIETLEDYQHFTETFDVPCLANITEFGKTPLFDRESLASVGVQMVLYPLSAFRLMNRAAERGYQEILKKGHQRHLLDEMQTREELYHYLDYHSYEQKLDNLLSSK